MKSPAFLYASQPLARQAATVLRLHAQRIEDFFKISRHGKSARVGRAADARAVAERAVTDAHLRPVARPGGAC